jgi:hypothetical protein
MPHLMARIIPRLGSRALAGCGRSCSLACLTCCLVVSLVLTGCRAGEIAIQERQLPKRNPTAYEFDVPLDAVIRALDEARGIKWHGTQNSNEGGYLAWNGGNLFTRTERSQEGNEAVAYLNGMGNAVGKSHVYLKDGRELAFFADFQIRLTSISNSKTRVDIVTHDSFVEAGTELHPFARAGIFVDVPPTTIEEYQILLDVGKQLGAQDMPKLITPDPGSPTKKLRATRRR